MQMNNIFVTFYTEIVFTLNGLVIIELPIVVIVHFTGKINSYFEK